MHKWPHFWIIPSGAMSFGHQANSKNTTLNINSLPLRFKTQITGLILQQVHPDNRMDTQVFISTNFPVAT